jgi:colicin import membrane protein
LPAIILCSAIALAGNTARAAEPAEIQSLVEAGNLKGALSRTETALAREPSDINLRFLQGLIYTRMNRLDDAAAVFTKLTEEHPELPEPYNNLAVVHAARGDFEKARQALQRAISTHPSYATAHENMGDIYAKMASQAYNQALQLDEDNAMAKAKLALIDNLFSMPDRPASRVAPAEPPPAAAAEPIPAIAAATPSAPAVELPETVVEAPVAAAVHIPDERSAVETAVQPVELVPEPIPEPGPQLPAQAVAGDLPATAGEAAPPEPQAVAVAESGADTGQPAPGQMEIVRLSPAPSARTGDASSVRRAVDLWATAWSAQDTKAYLSHYAEEFTPPGGQSRSAWAKSRDVRLTKPRFIKVELSDLDVVMHGDDHAQATFAQLYQSDTYSDRIRKTLLLKKVDGRWLIIEEKSQ